jgi:hypothetical protein
LELDLKEPLVFVVRYFCESEDQWSLETTEGGRNRTAGDVNYLEGDWPAITALTIA